MAIEIRGVALLLFSAEGKLAVIKEKKSKPIIEKEAGMLSFPMETTLDGELPEQTLARLLYEELGLNESEISGLSRLKKVYVEHNVELTIFHAFLMEKQPKLLPIDTGDVKFEGWMYPENLKARYVRREVIPVLGIFDDTDLVRCCKDRKKLQLALSV